VRLIREGVEKGVWAGQFFMKEKSQNNSLWKKKSENK